jgi:Holliday junction resolvase RusA-like endonuclease
MTAQALETARSAEFFVPSKPAPQGNHRISAQGHIYEQSSAQLAAWRDAVVFVARVAWHHEQLLGPVHVAITFYLPRPKTSTRMFPTVRPDADKLARAALDACTVAGIWADDAQVVTLYLAKRYAALRGPGAHFSITEIDANNYEGGVR